MDKYHPGYFGKVGMRHFNKHKNHYHCPIINLDKLWTLLGEEKRLECAKATGKAPVIDLTDFGIFKVSDEPAATVEMCFLFFSSPPRRGFCGASLFFSTATPRDEQASSSASPAEWIFPCLFLAPSLSTVTLSLTRLLPPPLM